MQLDAEGPEIKKKKTYREQPKKHAEQRLMQ